MKKTLFSLFALIIVSFGASAQIVNIPDANFKAYLVGTSSYNTNSDTEIQVSEAEASTYLNLNNLNISDLTGVEAFVNLVTLVVSNNQLTTIDLSQNTLLSGLNVSNNLLTSLDVSQNTLLTGIGCNSNNISVLDVTQNTNLVSLFCQINNISVLDLSQNTALIQLVCYQNTIGTLDLSNTSINQNTTLEIPYIDCKQNNLTVLKMNNISINDLNGQSFFATSNPNLTCIDADDVAAATSVWTNIDPGVSFNLNCQIDLITSISVQGQSGISSIDVPAGTLQMEANVLPTYADDNTYTWSVVNGTGSASIDANGVLTALTDGLVSVKATANDASGVTGTTSITISNQSAGINIQSGINSIKLFPNPVTSELTIESKNTIESIVIANIAGQVVRSLTAPNNTIDLSDLSKGLYNIQITTEHELINKTIIKE